MRNDGINYREIDLHVRPLVRVLNMVGYPTHSSCEGHIGDWRASSPQISVCRNGGESKYYPLINAINRYNKSSEIKWCLDDVFGIRIDGLSFYSITTDGSATNHDELRLLHESALSLARFLHKTLVEEKFPEMFEKPTEEPLTPYTISAIGQCLRKLHTKQNF